MFIASKIEEIYPPKLSEFAYVTDGACTEEEILQMELIILKQLNWGLSPMTPNGWMKIYMQIVNCDVSPNNETFVIPQFTGIPFVKAMQLIDLCMLDMKSLDYTYSKLAAAALAHISGKEIALAASQYQWHDIEPCYNWMCFQYKALRDGNQLVTSVKAFNNVRLDECHNRQTHSVDLGVMEHAQEMWTTAMSRASPVPSSSGSPPLAIVTPPEGEGDVHMARTAGTTCGAPGTPTNQINPASTVFLSPQTPTSSRAKSYQ